MESSMAIDCVSHYIRKLKELKSTHQRIKERVDGIKSEIKEAERISDRSALLGNPASTSASATTLSNQLTEDSLREREDGTMRYAETRLNDYISIGTSTLDGLRLQRQTLKSAQKRVFDAGTSLGVSQSLMRIISRRTSQDRYIFYAGVIVTIIVIYLCYKYLW